MQPADDRWAFTCVADHVGLLTYAAWQPSRMSPATAFVASSAHELAEDLWAYYFERSLDLPVAPSPEAVEAVRRIEAVLDPTSDLHLYFATQQQVYDRMREAQWLLETRDFLGARLTAEAALQDGNVLIAPLLARLLTLHGAACAGMGDVDAAQRAFEEAIRQAGGSPVIPDGQDFPDPFATVPPRLALARLLLDQHALDAADRCLQGALASCERAMDDPNLRSGATVSYAEGLSRLVALALRRGHQHVALPTAERALTALNRHPTHDPAGKVRILADLATTLRDHHALAEARAAVDRGLQLAHTYVRADAIGMVPVFEQLHQLVNDLAIRGLPPQKTRKRTRAAVPLPQAALNAIRVVDDPWFRSWALADLAPALPASLLDDAARLALAVDDPWAVLLQCSGQAIKACRKSEESSPNGGKLNLLDLEWSRRICCSHSRFARCPLHCNNTLGEHMLRGVKSHTTHEIDAYSLLLTQRDDFKVEAYWPFCPTCGKMLSKPVVGEHPQAREYYVWDIISKGMKVE